MDNKIGEYGNILELPDSGFTESEHREYFRGRVMDLENNGVGTIWDIVLKKPLIAGPILYREEFHGIDMIPLKEALQESFYAEDEFKIEKISYKKGKEIVEVNPETACIYHVLEPNELKAFVRNNFERKGNSFVLRGRYSIDA